MLCKEVEFDDDRCRNIFVSLVKAKLPNVKIMHKSHTTYQKVYFQSDEYGWEEKFLALAETYKERREEFLKKVGQLIDRLLDATEFSEKDWGGEEFVKINFPSPFSFLFIEGVLSQYDIEIKEELTYSTAIIGVSDEKEFNDKFWKGELKPVVEKLENKIDKIATVYLEDQNE